ncbi:MAG: hypothetical protein JXK07_03455 [Spirochaetes bacterium]|nr:hypothetical protein [Spirochaetota bacterium]
MRTDFIHIDSIEDIDTSKASVYDLNKRYMDKNGTMYGLRFNRSQRKVEIIRILRTSNDRAQMIRHRIREKKKQDIKELAELGDIPENSDDRLIEDEIGKENEIDDYYTENNDDSDSDIAATGKTMEPGAELSTIETELKKFNPDHFIKEIFDTINTHRDRFNGVINNIHNSKMISPDDRELSNMLEDTHRSLDIDGFQKIEDIISIYREINEYPRPISFYITHLDPRCRDILNQMQTDKQKYHYILLYEMDQHLKHVYKKLLGFADSLQKIIDEIEMNMASKINALARQNLKDATFTLETTIGEIKTVLTKLTTLEQYIKTERNFIQQ